MLNDSYRFLFGKNKQITQKFSFHYNPHQPKNYFYFTSQVDHAFSSFVQMSGFLDSIVYAIAAKDAAIRASFLIVSDSFALRSKRQIQFPIKVIAVNFIPLLFLFRQWRNRKNECVIYVHFLCLRITSHFNVVYWS